RIGYADVELFNRIAHEVQLAANIVEEMIDAHAEFIHQVRLENPGVVDQPLVDGGGDEEAVEIELRIANGFVAPAKPAEPVRLGVFDEIDTRVELVLVG